MEKVSHFGLTKYRIMRSLFKGALLYGELANDTDLTDLELIRGLGILISKGFINKEKVEVLPTSQEALRNKKAKHLAKYSLTINGEKKLAYLEYRDSLYKQWSPVSQSLSGPYIQEINKIIKENKYFGSPP